MRALMCVVLVAWSGAVMAQDIVQANAAFAAKDYPKAMSLYSALAASNNADALFAKAAAAGNKEAAADLQLTAQRAQKTAAIAYWTTDYHGEDLTEGKFACTPLTVPQISKTTEEVKDLSARAEAWRTCYTGFVANIGDAMPPGKRIPEDVAIVMSEAELQQAKTHLDRVYAEVLQREKSKSLVTIAELDKWQAKTASYMKKMDGRSAEYRQALDDVQRMHDQGAARTIR